MTTSPLARGLAALLVTGTMLLTGCSAQLQPADAASSPSSTTAPTQPESSLDGKAAAPAQAYVDAVNRNDLQALVDAFAPDGQVNDVSRPIKGRDAIRAWADREVMGGRLDVLTVTPIADGQDLLVHWAPAGSDGWRAHYRFTMTDSHITLADLQYA